MNNQLNEVLECFADMNVDSLDLILAEEQFYYDVPKELFLSRLKEFFDEFKSKWPNQKKLKFYPGACCNKSCDLQLGRTAFRFVSEEDGIYFDLRFILEKMEDGTEYVKDIFTCYDLITNDFIPGLTISKNFWVFEDDKISVVLDADHHLLVNQAEEGISSWVTNLKDKAVSLKEINSWLIKFESTYLEIGGFKEYYLTHWRWDNFLKLFHDIRKLYKFISDFQEDFEKMEEIKNSLNSENDLLNTILEWENRLESGYAELYGPIFSILKEEDCFFVTIRLETTVKVVDSILGKAIHFLEFFDKEREKLLIKYFSFTRSELEEFEENTHSPYELYQVAKSLNYHISIREKFKNQGILIPYNLGEDPKIKLFKSS